MTAFVLRRAGGGDLDAVLSLLSDAARWLARRHIDQWPADGFPASRITKSLARGQVYLLKSYDGVPAATVTVDGLADPEFWLENDDPRNALYTHKLAVSRAFSGQGLGALLLDWAAGRAATAGCRWLRLDCAKNNPGLQDFYRSLGFQHIRTVDLSHRSSGALFQRPSALRTCTSAPALHDATKHVHRTCPVCRVVREKHRVL